MTERQELQATFSEAYDSLNVAQKKAVDTIDGPVMVVAGPGTGKTQILTLRIANILKETDATPDSILALTFTESGAKAMRERLRRYLGADAYQVGIFTFHGFAQSLIGQYPESYDRIIGGRPATDIEKISIIEELLAGNIAPTLRPPGHPTYYVTPLLRMLSNLKQENISPDKLSELIATQEQQLSEIQQYHEKGAHKGKVRGEYSDLEKSIEKNRGLLAVYRAYQAALTERRLYDFDDMIIETVKALESSEDMLRDVQERYQYILADEHQDVNGAQNRILELLADFHDRPNIFAVGDEKQAIYRFQGASLENFLYFTESFKDTNVISLTDNYRSGQPVLDAAHDLIKVDDQELAKLRVQLTAKLVTGAELEERMFDHQAVEDEWVVEEVQKELAAGVAASDIAVILRTNKEVEAMAEALRAAGVAVAPSAEGDVLDHPVTLQIISLIRAVTRPEDEQALATVLHGAYWGVGASDVVRLLRARSYDVTVRELLADEEKLQSLNVSNTEAVAHVNQVLETARGLQTTTTPHHVLAYLLRDSGFLQHVMTADPLDGARVVRRLYDEIESLVVRSEAASLHDVLAQLSARQSYGLPLNAPYITAERNAVQVMTAHKSKGLEFTTVIIPHLTESNWSGVGGRTYFKIPITFSTAGSDPDTLEDERRLLYVALTRAKRKLLISHAQTNSQGKELVPSRFIELFTTDSFSTVATDDNAKKFSVVEKLTKPVPNVSIDQSLLLHTLTERGFSATSLNNYLKSPWDYFYRNVLRLPEPQTLPLQFGTAMHNTLEYATRAHTSNGALPSDTEVKAKLEQELGRLPLGTHDFTQLLEKGLSALYPYLSHIAATLPQQTKEELKVSVVLETGIPEIPQIPLTGKLDRIDLGEDGRALRVVDYKTGKPKSRNVIEGNTKTSDGGYKRQLVFYALLLKLYDDDRYMTRTGVLSFVEPTPKGEIKEELFEITNEEIEELQETIVEAAKSVAAGDFLKQAPTKDESEYWQLAQLLLQV